MLLHKVFLSSFAFAIAEVAALFFCQYCWWLLLLTMLLLKFFQRYFTLPLNFSFLRYQNNLSSSRHVPPSPLGGDPRSGLLLRLPRVDAAGRGGGEVPGARRVQGEPLRHIRGRGQGAAGGGAAAGHHAALPGQLKYKKEEQHFWQKQLKKQIDSSRGSFGLRISAMC